MRKPLATLVLSALLVVGTVGSAYGSTLNLFNDPGTQQVTNGISTFVTGGGDMAGMNFTAYFFDGNTATASWKTIAPGTGDVTLADPAIPTNVVTVAESGDTFFNSWTLTSNAQLSRLVIDAGTGDTVFDQTFGGAVGTTGSSFGITFAVIGVTNPADSSNLVFDVTYRDIVALTGQPPVGDLYRVLDISISNQQFTIGAPPDQNAPPVNLDFTFNQDTDNLQFSGDIGPEPSSVPEPATMLLLGGALSGLAAIRRRRAR